MEPGAAERRVREWFARHAVLRLLPHLGVLVLVGVAAGNGAGRITNPDTYFHLRFGAEFWGHWSPWHPGSVTRFATREWVPTQWLSEIVMGRFEAWFGLPGVAWLTGLGIVAYAVTLYVVSRRWAPAIVAVVLAALALTASGDGLSGRPQLASYVLVTVVVGAWLRTSEDGRPRWWLVAVAWVWPLLHGMWVLGIVISTVGALGVVLEGPGGRPGGTPGGTPGGGSPAGPGRGPRGGWDRRSALRLLGVPVAMAVASALTVLGPGIYGAVLVVGSRRDHFAEWAPPDFTSGAPVFLALLLAVLVVAALRQGPSSWFRVLMVLLCGAWAVYSSRTVPVAAASAAPLASMVLGERFGRATATRSRDRVTAYVAAGVSLVVLAVVVPFTADQPRPYPAWVDTELAPQPRGTGLLVYDSDGSYLTWRHPNVDVVAFGYGDTFTDAELDRADDLDGLAPDWEDQLHRTGIELALLPDTAPLTRALEVRGWRIAHDSGGLEYLLAP